MRKPLLLIALLVGLPIGIALASAGGVESGGYLFFPKVKITNAVTDTTGIELGNDIRIEMGSVATIEGTSSGLTIDAVGNTLTCNASTAFTGSTNTFSGSIQSATGSQLEILSQASAVTATTAVPAVLIQTTNALNANDLMLDVQNSSGTSRLKVDAEGDATFAGDVIAIVGDVMATRITDSGGTTRVSMVSNTAIELVGKSSDATSGVGLRVGNNVALTTAGSKIAAFYSDSLTTERMSIRDDGTLDLAGADTGSLIAAADVEGGIQYDLTTNTLKYSDGSQWIELTSSDVSKVSTTNTVDIAAITAHTCNNEAFTVNIDGVSATSACTVNGPAASTGIAGHIVPYAWPSSGTTVTVRLCCNNSSDCDPASQTYTVVCVL